MTPVDVPTCLNMRPESNACDVSGSWRQLTILATLHLFIEASVRRGPASQRATPAESETKP